MSYGITDNPDGETAFEQLEHRKKKTSAKKKDIPESKPEQITAGSEKPTEESAAVSEPEDIIDITSEIPFAEKPFAIPEPAEPVKPAKKISEPAAKPADMTDDFFGKPLDGNAMAEFKKAFGKKPETEKAPEPKPEIKKDTPKKADKPAEDSFFDKPLSDAEKDEFKKTFGKKKGKNAEKPAEKAIEKPIEKVEEKPAEPPVDESEMTAFQKLEGERISRFWEDPFAPKIEKPKALDAEPAEKPIEKTEEKVAEQPAPQFTETAPKPAEPAPIPEPKPVEKKTNSLPPMPAEVKNEDDFFNKPLDGDAMAEFKKSFAKKEEKPAEPTPIPEPKPVEKKTNSLPPMPAEVKNEDDFFNKPLDGDAMAEFKKSFAKKEEKPAEPTPIPEPKPVEKKTNSLPPMPAEVKNEDDFFNKPLDGDAMAEFKKSFAKKEEKPAEPAPIPEPKLVEKKTNSLPPMPAEVKSEDDFFNKPLDDSTKEEFNKAFGKKKKEEEIPLEEKEQTAFQKAMLAGKKKSIWGDSEKPKPPKKPAAPKLAKHGEDFFNQPLDEDEQAMFDRAFGKKKKAKLAPEDTNTAAAVLTEGAPETESKKDEYIPIKLEDMYDPAADAIARRNAASAVPVTSKDFKLEGIGEMYRPEKEFNRDEFWANAKKGLNSEESREMYWQLRREQRDKKQKRGLLAALSVCILGVVCAVAMLLSREFGYIHMGITVFMSFLIMTNSNFVKVLGILGSLFNAGWAGYFGVQYYLATGFSTDTEFLIKAGCFLGICLFSFIIFIRLCTSKTLKEYYASESDKVDKSSIIKNDPMNMR